MIPGLKAAVEAALGEACRRLYGIDPPRVVLETPPKVELGDVALPAALQLAKVLKRSPKDIAQELAKELALPELVVERTVQGGFLNLKLDRPKALAAMLSAAPGSVPPPPAEAGGNADKVIVEHTNINPNKAAHIGHLRNAILGDTLVRAFRRAGRNVEVQNYLDDTGVQVADVVVGVQHAAELAEARRATALASEIQEILDALPDELPGVEPRRLGDLAWDLYALVGRSYAADPALEPRRHEVLHAIEGAALGRELTDEARATAELAGRLAGGVVRCHLRTMERVGVAYDLLPRESDILARHFWTKAFEMLKAAGAARLVEDGKNAGCWVMPLEGSAEFEGMEDADKILLRSNGTVTYTGKDIAYQLWKLGLLGLDFEYEPVPYRDVDGSEEFLASDGVSPLYRTCPDEVGADPAARGRFGGASSVVNVIDVRQSYPQKVVKEGVRRAGFPEQAARSIHFAYEMVALTPAAAEALGLAISDEDRQRPFVEMSGRKGLGIKADELLDRMVEKARDAVIARGDRPEPGRAEAIAVGALRVYMTRFSRNKVIAFDFDEALAFEGDTGPYLQYAAVRGESIFRKLAERGLPGRLQPEELQALETLPREHFDDALWDVVRTCGRTADTLEKVVETLEVSLLVRHALALAGAFHHLYHTHPILNAEDESSRLARRAALQLTVAHLTDILEVLGVPVPEKM